MKDLDLPTAAIPLDDLMGLIEGVDWCIDEQQPLDGLIDICGRVLLAHQDGVERNGGQL